MGDLTTNFSRSEFACKCGCGKDNISLKLVKALQKLRSRVNKPITVHSGCRCPAWNASPEVRGVKNSFHCQGIAADITADGWSTKDLARTAEGLKEFREGGIGRYFAQDFVHLDVRGYPARWDE